MRDGDSANKNKIAVFDFGVTPKHFPHDMLLFDYLTLDVAGFLEPMAERGDVRNPISGDGCCPPAASGHAAVAPPSSVMNARRFMPDMGLSHPVRWVRIPLHVSRATAMAQPVRLACRALRYHGGTG